MYCSCQRKSICFALLQISNPHRVRMINETSLHPFIKCIEGNKQTARLRRRPQNNLINTVKHIINYGFRINECQIILIWSSVCCFGTGEDQMLISAPGSWKWSTLSVFCTGRICIEAMPEIRSNQLLKSEWSSSYLCLEPLFFFFWLLPSVQESVMLQFCGNKLDKKDFFGKSDPFLVFYRSNEDGS